MGISTTWDAIAHSPLNAAEKQLMFNELWGWATMLPFGTSTTKPDAFASGCRSGFRNCGNGVD